MRLRSIGLVLIIAGCALTTHTSSSGLGHPDERTLARFGLGLRCHGEDASCMDRAVDLAAEIAISLGQPYAGPVAAGPVAADRDQPSRLVIDAAKDPPFEWRASDDTGGTTINISFDLTDVLDATGPAFAVIGVAGDPEAPMYVVSDEHAVQLLESLFGAG